jgi:hypothetical protein
MRSLSFAIIAADPERAKVPVSVSVEEMPVDKAKLAPQSGLRL